MRPELGLLFFSFVAALSSQVKDNDTVLVKFTRSHLEAATALTGNENTRLEGLRELIRMAGPRLYEGSMVFAEADSELFELRGEAVKAVAACRDIPTVGKALDSPNRTLRLWAVLSFENRDGYKNTWRPLVPKLVTMLSDPDAGVRQNVVDKLWAYPEGPSAIAGRAPVETNPEVLLHIARSGSSPDFYGSIVRLLSGSDASDREAALSFIYLNLWNKATAPMWRLGFNQEVYRQVQILSRAPSQRERESARKALTELDALRKTVVH
jgi:hypothetical protein